ncbi:Dihydrolipoyl dehydrogenase 1, mitochondrial [Auxenochlorella protothecoides]|uniref:Dihydrolipoyl dehydrogenase n=1 Tax=Auxenochlorella protothecoides TaxID=3075 RepID=A0A087SJ64_AUXPR|nr:Dihydrolipoyl dehydrogenase 1, mitochondrial [Auxenochlorella protothecoides]KFM25768.1 Dihydrolipoyl dehydrogenase 1, mitochondrial [Auxenochlorella protothecoides]RMZ57185.1 hypothetical protein APUTEX25_004019 [Auxenochlorella protothecoides]|eukprot:RMZ57185.1 hypothetical protein APUTEX25_004019 [Auxenochlorella protothecoides]
MLRSLLLTRKAAGGLAACRPGVPLLSIRGFASSEEQDVVVIGGGPGGYVAAIKAAQMGLKTTCVEGRGTLGGTCLNVGCIPSKARGWALLHSSHMFHEAQHTFAHHGIKVSGLEVDVAQMMAQKTKAVTGLTKGIEGLFKKNKVTYVKGWGSLKSGNEVEVAGADGETSTIKAKNILIATGSEVTPLRGVEIDEEKVVSSTGILELKEVPKKLVVVGGGIIGLEMGSVWARLGAEVTVVEFLDNILPSIDGEVRKLFERTLKKAGFKIKLSTKVVSADTSGEGVKLTVEPAKGGDQETLEADIVLVATGRRPFTKGLGLENVGVEVDERGRIKVDDHFRSNVSSVLAIGDVIPGPMLAHKAEEDGVAAAEILAGKNGHVNYANVPSVMYTWPEVASVGITEEQAKADGLDYKVGKFPFMANSRAKTIEDTDGMVKFISDAKTDKILGAHIMGPNAGELIQECVLALEYGASTEDIGRTCHAHPTMSEAIKEAAMATYGKPIHM